jgi:hypothetical protein
MGSWLSMLWQKWDALCMLVHGGLWAFNAQRTFAWASECTTDRTVSVHEAGYSHFRVELGPCK